MPCAVPGAIVRPHCPTVATWFSTASVRASDSVLRRNASGSTCSARAISSTIISFTIDA